MRNESTMSRGLFVAAAAVFFLCGAPRTALAADAVQVLKEASAAIAAQKTFLLDATVEYRGKYQGSEEEVDTTFAIALDRAGQLSIHVENPDSEMSFYRTDTEFTRYIPAFNQYVVETPEMSAEELIVLSGFELIEPAMRAVATLVVAEPFSGAFTPEGLSYVGSEPQNGRACDRIRFTAAGYTYDVWIEEAPGRLVRRIEPDMAPLEEKFSAQYGTQFDFQVAAVLSTWDVGADVSNAVKFSAPDDALKVAQFMPPRPESEAEKLAGSPAPDFTLPLLAGGELALSKEKGNVILLDFWATWCVPCRRGLPVIKVLHDELDGKGVKIFSVNQADDPEVIKQFLTEFGLEGLPVALDADRGVSDNYFADMIPQTVIIGRDGVIRKVHLGIPLDPADAQAATSQEEMDKLVGERYLKTLREELNQALAEPASTSPPAGR